MGKIFLAGALGLMALGTLSLPAVASDKQEGDWVLRGRAIWVVPNEDEEVTPAAVGGDADLSNEFVPEVDLSYFFTDHVAAELILAVAKHDVSLENTAAGGVDLGTVWHAPVTLLLQYHFDPMGERRISPYVGAGVNYTIFFSEDGSSQLNGIDYDNSLGLALQAGADMPVGDKWSFNVDVKYIDINTDLDTNVIGVGDVSADVGIDPWIVGVGLGYTF